MRFLCDQMLARLGRWLRAAGYDTIIIDTPITDREVLEIALKEGRGLITRDRHFLDIKEAKDILPDAFFVMRCLLKSMPMQRKMYLTKSAHIATSFGVVKGVAKYIG